MTAFQQMKGGYGIDDILVAVSLVGWIPFSSFFLTPATSSLF
jgi:hypothetical protein